MNRKTPSALAAALALVGVTTEAVTVDTPADESNSAAIMQGAPPSDLVSEAAALVTMEQAEADATAAAADHVIRHREMLEAKHLCEAGSEPQTDGPVECASYAAADVIYRVALDEARFRAAVRERKARGP